MEKTFNNTDSILYSIVKAIRKEKNFSQEALGKFVRLGEDPVYQIENRQDDLSLRDASVLVETMGEDFCNYVKGKLPSFETSMEQMEFVIDATCWFAEAKNISRQNAFSFLQKNQGIEFLEDDYEYEQTLPKETIVEDLTIVCCHS